VCVHAHVRERARVRMRAMHVYERASASRQNKKCYCACIHLIWDVCICVYVCARACVRACTCAQAVYVDLLYDHTCAERQTDIERQIDIRVKTDSQKAHGNHSTKCHKPKAHRRGSGARHVLGIRQPCRVLRGAGIHLLLYFLPQ